MNPAEVARRKEVLIKLLYPDSTNESIKRLGELLEELTLFVIDLAEDNNEPGSNRDEDSSTGEGGI